MNQIVQKISKFFLKIVFGLIFFLINCAFVTPFVSVNFFLLISEAEAEQLEQTSTSSLNLENLAQYVWKISNSTNSGTAFAIGPNQFITNFHVIYSILKDLESSEEIALSQTGKTLSFNRLIKIDSMYDLALFETKESLSDYLHITDVSIEAGEKLFTIGYPQWVLTIVKKTARVTYEDDLSYGFAVNHTKLHGSSGSPLFNKKGQIAGVAYFSSTNILYAIRTKYLEEFVKGDTALDCSHFSNISSCFKREIENLKTKAEQGEVFSQYRLAYMYHDGEGVERNLELALYWFEKSAEQGYALAQTKLAWMYYHGVGVERNLELAVYWAEQSAEQDYAPAQAKLAGMYHDGKGVEKNLELALFWAKQSAEQGYALAQMVLAGMYYYAEGVEKNVNMAVDLYKKAAEQGYAPAQMTLSGMYYYGDGVEKNLKLAVYWYERSMLNGS